MPVAWPRRRPRSRVVYQHVELAALEGPHRGVLSSPAASRADSDRSRLAPRQLRAHVDHAYGGPDRGLVIVGSTTRIRMADAGVAAEPRAHHLHLMPAATSSLTPPIPALSTSFRPSRHHGVAIGGARAAARAAPRSPDRRTRFSPRRGIGVAVMTSTCGPARCGRARIPALRQRAARLRPPQPESANLRVLDHRGLPTTMPAAPTGPDNAFRRPGRQRTGDHVTLVASAPRLTGQPNADSAQLAACWDPSPLSSRPPSAVVDHCSIARSAITVLAARRRPALGGSSGARRPGRGHLEPTSRCPAVK